MDDYTHGESYLRTRFGFRDENETEKAVAALKSSRGAMPIEMALFSILEGASLLSDAEWNAVKPGLWAEYLQEHT